MEVTTQVQVKYVFDADIVEKLVEDVSRIKSMIEIPQRGDRFVTIREFQRLYGNEFGRPIHYNTVLHRLRAGTIEGKRVNKTWLCKV